jgi:hypothetical protein
VVVTPADPAVLHLAVPGALVDVWGPGEPAVLGVEPAEQATARLLASSAVVVDPGTRPADVPDPVGLIGVGPGTAAVTLAVTDAEASALAAQQGRGLMLAVRPGTAPGAARGTVGDPTTGTG